MPSGNDAALQLHRVVEAWGTPAFTGVLKAELEQLNVEQLPLQQGLSQSSYACDDDTRVVVISVAAEAGVIRATAEIFYSGIIPGCSCADDPGPVDEYAEHCTVQISIDRQTAAAVIKLLPS
jgi:hypothetical protein